MKECRNQLQQTLEISGSDQLEYYLSSLNELGEILIEADKVEQVGSGVLRLTLGTIMASKGVIFLYKKEKEELSFLASPKQSQLQS